jgi:methylmalonyl-CoA mutase N-terminal domain/subunit
LQTLAAVLGGTQSLHTNGYDEALSLPTEEAAKIALRTQQIIAYESGAPDTVDPLAGSYFIESLTNEMEEKAMTIIKKMDAMGGSVSAIEQGFMQDEIAHSAYDYQQKIERREKIIVGVNKFQEGKEAFVPSFKINDNIRDQQTERLHALKEKRNKGEVAKCLERIHQKAIHNENLMPAVIEAVENNCTLGEIADELRKVFGEHK